MQREGFQTFIGVDLGGGKGKKTSVAVLREGPDRDGLPGVRVERYDTGPEGYPWYDERLIALLLERSEGAVLAIDAPLSLPACVRCRVPVCPGIAACVDPTVVWMRERAAAHGKGPRGSAAKPQYTPYTQRATEIVLHEDGGILPRETLGQGMGPLTARAAHLVRALAGTYTQGENLIEVYPKATIWRLFGEETARSYKKHHAEQTVRLMSILERLPHLTFGPGQWKEFGVQKDHLLDAIVCAYTAWLWARGGWQIPAEAEGVFREDGWIWVPPA